MPENGYVKLYRKIINSRVFNNEGLLKVWIWCLCRANHEENWVSIVTGKGISEVLVKPGQFIYGRKSAAKELKMNESSVRNRMEKLKKIGNLDMQTDTHYTIISILNWDTYQMPTVKEDNQEDSHRTAIGQQKDTDKNDKNDKKEYIVVPYQQILDLYHNILPELTEVVKLTKTRKSHLKARWYESKNTQSLEWWKDFFELVKSRPFLLGNNNRGWKADFDFLITQSKFLAILEGKYQ